MLITKPWGHENIIEKNEYYVMKELFMKKGHKCSLQLHNFKHESFYVVSGKLKFTIGTNENDLKEIILNPNEYKIVPPKTIHRMEALEDSTYIEASTNHLDDVLRIKDDYNRIS